MYGPGLTDLVIEQGSRALDPVSVMFSTLKVPTFFKSHCLHLQNDVSGSCLPGVSGGMRECLVLSQSSPKAPLASVMISATRGLRSDPALNLPG